ncbi:hypothetical protein M9Y10_018632 [Tritrichomonas musculus]|uniref:Intimal thickness related receptor IRP domain-containing protein n=1 Tax=Tritrichomonas musculus TaxID=1915356 RepID=A0ABR2HN99_9EUKA
MLILSLITFLKTYTINDSSISVTLPDYGLIKGATYFLHIFDSNAQSFFVAILDSDEYSRLPHLSFSYASQFCSRIKTHFSRLNASLLSRIYEASVTFTIPKKDVYHPLIVACKAGSSSYSVTIQFKNGNSLLDSRRLPLFVVIPIELCACGVILILWMINLITYWKGRKPLHGFITLTMVLMLITIFFSYVTLLHDSHYESKNIFHFVQKIFVMFLDASLFSTLILTAKGWCIVINDLNPIDIHESVVYCSLYFVLITIYSNIKIEVFGIIIFAVTSALIFVILGTMINAIVVVDQHILGHLLVIQKAGIDPLSTPVYSKHVTYSLFKHAIVLYFSFCIMTMSLSLTDFVPEWLTEMTFWVANVGIVACLCFQFRIRKSDCSEYTKFENFEEVNEKMLEDLEQNILSDNKDLIQWYEGMLLPPQPIIINSNIVNNNAENTNNDQLVKKEENEKNDPADMQSVIL